MECRKVRTRISAHIDGELDAASSRSVERHIDRCAACRKMAADFRAVDDLVRGLPKLGLGDDFAGQLLEKVSKSNAPAARKLFYRSPFAPVIRFMSSFMDLLEAKDCPSTRTLDEFGDFPPFSMGFIYFKLMDQPERG